MKILILALTIAMMGALPSRALADPGSTCHFHGSRPASEQTVMQCANIRKNTLIKAGKLDKTWSSAKNDSVALVKGKNGLEWRVVYTNIDEPNSEQNTLYLFFTPPGNFIAANFSGN
jgi:hypothetical protein